MQVQFLAPTSGRSRGSNALFWLLWAPATHRHIYACTWRKINKSFSKKNQTFGTGVYWIKYWDLCNAPPPPWDLLYMGDIVKYSKFSFACSPSKRGHSNLFCIIPVSVMCCWGEYPVAFLYFSLSSDILASFLHIYLLSYINLSFLISELW